MEQWQGFACLNSLKGESLRARTSIRSHANQLQL